MRNILSRLRHRCQSGSTHNYPYLTRKVITLRDLSYLTDYYGWSLSPQLDPSDFMPGRPDPTQANGRRFHDASVLSTICLNTNPQTVLEIGTSHGQGTLLLAKHLNPSTQIFTVNLPPEEGDGGGKNITHVLNRNEIGRAYRNQGYENIHQIYANTWGWKPNVGQIDLAFIDGCHDRKFVVNDTLAVLPHMKHGGWIVWHDFCPAMSHVFRWIGEVCGGVDDLYAKGHLRDFILHLQDSWTGIYQVQKEVPSSK